MIKSAKTKSFLPHNKNIVAVKEVQHLRDESFKKIDSKILFNKYSLSCIAHDY
jgi:hypothetical protein